jgi:hypothetical protein
MDYHIICQENKTGKAVTFDTDNVIVIFSIPGENGALNWSAFQHIQAALMAGLLKKLATTGIFEKLDINGLLGKVFASKFGGGK